MPKSRQEKQAIVQSLSQGLRSAKSAVFANFQGLKVSEAEELRKTARKENVEVLAVKKTLIQRVFEDVGLTAADPFAFPGGIAAFFGADEVTPAKIVNTFAKTHEVVTVFGGVLEGKFIDAVGVKRLAALPGKTELLSKLFGTLQAPISGFVNALAGNLRDFVTVLRNIQEARSES